MNPTELDAYLREHTEHEDRYLQGWVNPVVKAWIDGNTEPVPRVSFSAAQVAGSPKYQFKKHSRFNDYPEHVHGWVEFEYMYAGSCVQRVNDTPIELGEGQCILLDQNTKHKVPRLGEDQILLNFMVGPESIEELLRTMDLGKSVVSELLTNTMRETAKKDSYIFFASEGSWRMRSLVEMFCCDFVDGGPHVDNRLEAVVHLMMYELASLCREGKSSTSMEKVDEISVLPALKLIERDYDTITLEVAAAELGISPAYLSRLLKKRTGSSFQKLLVRQRMSEAARLLSNPHFPVTEVAERVGYENVTFFYRKFKQEFGCTPGEWRKRQRS